MPLRCLSEKAKTTGWLHAAGAGRIPDSRHQAPLEVEATAVGGRDDGIQPLGKAAAMPLSILSYHEPDACGRSTPHPLGG